MVNVKYKDTVEPFKSVSIEEGQVIVMFGASASVSFTLMEQTDGELIKEALLKEVQTALGTVEGVVDLYKLSNYLEKEALTSNTTFIPEVKSVIDFEVVVEHEGSVFYVNRLQYSTNEVVLSGADDTLTMRHTGDIKTEVLVKLLKMKRGFATSTLNIAQLQESLDSAWGVKLDIHGGKALCQ